MMVPRDVPTEYIDVAAAISPNEDNLQSPSATRDDTSDPMLAALVDDPTEN
jgi:hypothetical protein